MFDPNCCCGLRQVISVESGEIEDRILGHVVEAVQAQQGRLEVHEGNDARDAIAGYLKLSVARTDNSDRSAFGVADVDG